MKLAISFIFQHKRQSGYKYCKIKLSSDAISHGASKEPEAYLELSQTSTYEGAFL